jgi:hypothetical protein
MGALSHFQVEQLAALIRGAARGAAQFDGDPGVRAGAMLGGIEATLCIAVEWAGGAEARRVVEAELRSVNEATAARDAEAAAAAKARAA